MSLNLPASLLTACGTQVMLPVICKLISLQVSRKQLAGAGLWQCRSDPPKTMNSTMTPGPMASAASVLGAKEPTASPRDVDAKLSSVRIPQNFANLQQPRIPLPQ